ncbi:MAG: sulfatase [Planctomycetota bacterium]|nr:sulfatase [Planctomycetota bacterium]
MRRAGIALLVLAASCSGGDEPPRDERPDIVLFLADTFRADGLSFYGGEHDVTPRLDAFAAESLRFQNAWSSSSWTLPSHVSMFFGLHPYQHGATRHGLKPGKDLTSIAEKLRAAGYRTAAITDSLYVSRRFDLDRGFEWFHEAEQRDLDATIERALEQLAADDDRPLFLFVHTYRTHEPYEASRETREEYGERLGIEGSWEGLLDELAEAHAERGDEATAERLRQGDFYGALRELALVVPGDQGSGTFLHRLKALYYGGVADLDRAFGLFLARIPSAANTWVIFTSDHGEAFGEHGGLFHGRGVWEENLRIPLLIRGPGLEQRTAREGASLVDLPHTIAEIAGIAPDPSWEGRSLLSLEDDAPVYLFDCAQRGTAAAAVVDHGLKLVLPATREGIEGRELLHAFDLGADPGETNELGDDGRVGALLDRRGDRLLELLTPHSDAETVLLDPEELRRLKAAGYMGSDECDGG